jgi:hypothetical protein
MVTGFPVGVDVTDEFDEVALLAPAFVDAAADFLLLLPQAAKPPKLKIPHATTVATLCRFIAVTPLGLDSVVGVGSLAAGALVNEVTGVYRQRDPANVATLVGDQVDNGVADVNRFNELDRQRVPPVGNGCVVLCHPRRKLLIDDHRRVHARRVHGVNTDVVLPKL